ncbi:Gfo/Idh/MocA family protein [Spirosoma montaniterrae]|uniref:Gfo/Idh/MocA-like oxidoreductase N-terminal domain-containing protein n=1 Tax=Spirosoma montaniterrae TaxID=1178516 RepID=A0A1P9WYZ5_9BACT|nr:Gfo/Idh/MocA family oxidoreductase [Spirosoma montaniterrae]AQG80574.1 hypothetical protein AWR27_15345 [Spirosoma montaniterrae]
MSRLRKLFRFAGLYGWQRTLTKTIARNRRLTRWLPTHLPNTGKADVSVIGCGQFAFSTVCFFLRKHMKNRFLSAYDPDVFQRQSLGRYYGFRQAASTPNALLTEPGLRVLYVLSNHASHTPYAVAGLDRGLTVYIEKPVAISWQQLVALSAAQRRSTGQLVAGYNRPYAPAIQTLRERVRAMPNTGSFVLTMHINGHAIATDHWYRHPAEGSRICGNLGHWIDLTLHVWHWRSLPNWIDVRLTCARAAEPDDSLCLTLTTDHHDLATIVLTSQTEPFEGVCEYINVQYGNLIARIDDFRSLTCWQGPHRQTIRYQPKNLGHERTVLQPFRPNNREWREVELSSLLMLHVYDMLLTGAEVSRFVIADQYACFEQAVNEVNNCPIPF